MMKGIPRPRLAIAIAAIAAAAASCGLWALRRRAPDPGEAGGFAGSASCRGCHEAFFEKWSASWHGLAMRPFTAAFARENLPGGVAGIEIRGRVYGAEIGAGRGLIRERGPGGEKEYPIGHVLGGKNVFYFLTPWTGGRLQVLPLAFDARKREWFETTGSMVRHAGGPGDEALDWTERELTFNASCFGCHVSQLAKNYSLEKDSYATVWNEPGINCESCHGPGRKHVQAMPAPGGPPPEDLEIIVTRSFSRDQMNSLCASCHAKLSPLTDGFRPGDLFLDHFNVSLLEDGDFYPDGRELGEGFTYTAWLMSPCAASGKLDCAHCHTASGRLLFGAGGADQACAPCHRRHVDDPAAHSHHPAGSEASRCVSCHMSETTFARMRRHDHTMLAPAPRATARFKSPNACNLCHGDRDAAWADGWVRKWYPRDYQAPLLLRAELIEAARRGDWGRLDEMAAYVGSPGRDEVFAASLLRLLQACPDPRKWPAYLSGVRDPSTLVRSSAARGLASFPGPEARDALIAAAGDPRRLVRIEAGASLARVPPDSLEPAARSRVESAAAEFEAAMRCQADDPVSHYNLGNHFQDRGDLDRAIAEYETALRLRPSFIPALVNASIAHARRGEPDRAEGALRKALGFEPKSAEANFNLGLLLAERGRSGEAEACFRAALAAEPGFAEAAYNLGVLISGDRPGETIEQCLKAARLRPWEPRYAYTLAFYLRQGGDEAGAAAALESLLEAHPGHIDGLTLLGAIYEETGRAEKALELYRSALAAGSLPEPARSLFTAKVSALEGR